MSIDAALVRVAPLLKWSQINRTFSLDDEYSALRYTSLLHPISLLLFAFVFIGTITPIFSCGGVNRY